MNDVSRVKEESPAILSVTGLLKKLNTSPDGLTEEEVQRRPKLIAFRIFGREHSGLFRRYVRNQT